MMEYHPILLGSLVSCFTLKKPISGNLGPNADFPFYFLLQGNIKELPPLSPEEHTHCFTCARYSMLAGVRYD